ncbi:hypothetical protein ABTN09_21135, partial [Acinetobacter baumannii]
MIRTRNDGKAHPLAQMFNRYYWL